MCSPIPGKGKAISLGICVSQVREHISLEICVPGKGTLITRDICSWVGEHISLGIVIIIIIIMRIFIEDNLSVLKRTVINRVV